MSVCAKCGREVELPPGLDEPPPGVQLNHEICPEQEVAGRAFKMIVQVFENEEMLLMFPAEASAPTLTAAMPYLRVELERAWEKVTGLANIADQQIEEDE